MSLIRISSLNFREIFPGIRARVVHSERTSQSWVDIDAGASFPEHRHPHEQTVTVLEGTLDLTVSGQLHRLTPGSAFVIPPDAPHSGRAVSACRVLDVFAPVRDDYR